MVRTEFKVSVAILVTMGALGFTAMDFTMSVRGSSSKVKTIATKVQIKTFEVALETFHGHLGRYPTSVEGLKILVKNPDRIDKWCGPYLVSHDVPKDPWKHDYIYSPTSTRGLKFEVHSLGPDGVDGTDDDIGNWSLARR